MIFIFAGLVQATLNLIATEQIKRQLTVFNMDFKQRSLAEKTKEKIYD